MSYQTDLDYHAEGYKPFNPQGRFVNHSNQFYAAALLRLSKRNWLSFFSCSQYNGTPESAHFYVCEVEYDGLWFRGDYYDGYHEKAKEYAAGLCLQKVRNYIDRQSCISHQPRRLLCVNGQYVF